MAKEKNVKPAEAVTVTEEDRSTKDARWHSPVFAAIVGGMLGIIGLIAANNLKIGGIVFGGTEYDSPTTKLTPRTAICFWHRNAPSGFRLIQSVGDGTWLEKQPDGMEYHHIEIGRVAQGPFQGAVLVRKENPKDEPWYVETFVPDIGSGNVLFYRPDKKSAWEYVSILETSTDNCPRMSPDPPRPSQQN